MTLLFLSLLFSILLLGIALLWLVLPLESVVVFLAICGLILFCLLYLCFPFIAFALLIVYIGAIIVLFVFICICILIKEFTKGERNFKSMSNKDTSIRGTVHSVFYSIVQVLVMLVFYYFISYFLPFMKNELSQDAFLVIDGKMLTLMEEKIVLVFNPIKIFTTGYNKEMKELGQYIFSMSTENLLICGLLLLVAMLGAIFLLVKSNFEENFGSKK